MGRNRPVPEARGREETKRASVRRQHDTIGRDPGAAFGRLRLSPKVSTATSRREEKRDQKRESSYSVCHSERSQIVEHMVVDGARLRLVLPCSGRRSGLPKRPARTSTGAGYADRLTRAEVEEPALGVGVCSRGPLFARNHGRNCTYETGRVVDGCRGSGICWLGELCARSILYFLVCPVGTRAS